MKMYAYVVYILIDSKNDKTIFRWGRVKIFQNR